jgi:hypothetical protein
MGLSILFSPFTLPAPTDFINIWVSNLLILWAYLMKVIPETSSVHNIIYVCFYVLNEYNKNTEK